VQPYDLHHATTDGSGLIGVARPDRTSNRDRWLTKADETGLFIPAGCSTEDRLFR
jgi:hypothetical protein